VAVLRLIDLLAGLSRLADLGFGLQAGEALRASALASNVARSMDLGDEDVRAALYSALLLHLGCVGYAHETARTFGDELVMGAASAHTNIADPRDVLTTFVPMMHSWTVALGAAPARAHHPDPGVRHGEVFATTACEVGRDARGAWDSPSMSSAASTTATSGGTAVGVSRRSGAAIRSRSECRVAVLTTVAVTFDLDGGVGSGRRGSPQAERRHPRSRGSPITSLPRAGTLLEQT
jgi:hypothetical protein